MPELINISFQEENDNQVWIKVWLTTEGKKSSFEVLNPNKKSNQILWETLEVIPHILEFETSYIAATASPKNGRDSFIKHTSQISQFAFNKQFRNVDCSNCFALRALEEKAKKLNKNS